MKALLHLLIGIVFTVTFSYADTEPNGDCTAVEVIAALEGAMSSVTTSVIGSVQNTADDLDFYRFTPQVDGTLNITTSSPNNRNFRLKIGSTCDGNEYYGQTTAKSHTIASITITAGDTIYLRLKERNSNVREYQLNFSFAAAAIITTVPEPEIGQCGIFPSGLTAYDTIAFNGAMGFGSASTLTDSDSIVATTVTPNNPPGTMEITCDGVDCNVEKPLIINYDIPYYASTDLSTVAITSDTEIAALDAKNYLVGTTAPTQPTVTFTASASYAAPSTRKFMKIASLDSTNKTGIKYIFNEGDYYIGSWYHRGNDLIIEVNGDVRIFIDGILQFEGNELHMNETGLASQLFVFGKSDFIFPNLGSAFYNAHAYFYTKGSFILNADANTGTGFTGAITAENDITLNNNQKFTYDPTGLGNYEACNWCESNTISGSGFYMVPFNEGGVDKTFELFCDASDPNDIKDLIALPIKNDSNNFVFNSDTVSNNYYDDGANPRTPFHAIEVNANTWEVKTRGSTTGAYDIMGGSFSNVNLLGTPFAIDWANTTISNCTDSKLRKAYYGQAVKIDTLNYDKATCNIDTMQIKLLDDYRHLVYSGQEVLEKTCKEMAEFVPDNLGILDDASAKGHFWIDPFDNNRASTSDIGADGRPVVAYCWYQQDLDYVWTFLLGLDAKVTVSKNDLTAKQDTCSELGLNFFVPNTKETFNRVRKFLLDKKGEWDGYTGTIDEKINALHAGNHYYIPAERDVQIWPYGPFGVYFPNSGNTKADGSFADWGDGADSPREYMSGSPMHNIESQSNYNESLGFKGWVSILGSQDLNKTEDWWIDDEGAGERLDCSQGGCTSKYYEPNGNYTANAWLNFLFDSQGWVYHNDDWNNNYPYYDYMCMAEDNYDSAGRHALVPGLFTVVDSGNGINDTNITTKIVNKPISFDLLLYEFNGVTGEIDTTQLETVSDKSVGVFLSNITLSGATEIPQLVNYLGEYSDFSGNSGRIPLPDFTSGIAAKKTFVTFYYCDTAGADWRTCWDYNDNPSAPVVNSLGGGSTSESYDYFATRPAAFNFTTTTGLNVKAGNTVDLSFQALAFDNQSSFNYNEVQNSSFSVDVNITDPAKVCAFPEININPDVAFTNGENNYTDYRFFEVGEYTVSIAEAAGAEFASIDSGDTPEVDRLITPFNDTMKIVPDHFEITFDYKNFSNGFTYLSSDLNMSSILDVNITAKRLGDPANPADDNITLNYTSGCYAKDFNLSVGHSAVPAALTKILYLESTTSTVAEAPSSDPVGFPFLPSSGFTTDHNGTADLSVQINFDRNVTQPVNPFEFALQTISSTDTDGTTGSVAADQNVTYYYGRSHSPRYRIEGNQGVIDLYYEVYCRNCDVSLLSQIAPNERLSVDDIGWFLNENHTITDGQVTAVSERSATNEVAETYQSLSTFSFVYDESQGYPFKTMMQTTAPAWLLYNRFDDTAASNEFMLEFNSKGEWSGKGSEITSVGSKASRNTARRINW